MQSTIKNPLEPQDLKDLKDGLQTAGTTLNGEMEVKDLMAGVTMVGTNGTMEPNGEKEVKDLKDHGD